MREDRRLDNKSDNELAKIKSRTVTITLRENGKNIDVAKEAIDELSNEQLAVLKEKLNQALNSGAEAVTVETD